MKKIAITQRIVEIPEYKETRDALDTRWACLFEQLSFIPVIIPTYYNPIKFLSEIRVDGVILSGGNDLYSISGNSIDKIRDDFEKQIVEYSIEKQIPLIGICRGMQIIAHLFKSEIIKINNHAGKRHKMIPIEGNDYYKFLSLADEINSYHKYGIKTLPNGFHLCAMSTDNTVEAFTHKELKIYAQMWHPERENPFEQWNMDLFHSFFC